MRHGLVSFTFDQFENWAVARRVVANLETFACKLGNDLFDCRRLMQLDQLPAPAAICSRSWDIAERKQFLSELRIKKVQVQILLMKFPHLFLVREVVDHPLIFFADFHTTGTY